MLQILAADIERLGLAWLPGARRQLAAFDHGAHLLQSGVGADRPAALTDEFQAVVIRRIVARGHHDPAIELGGKSREVDALRATKADVLDVDPGIVQATFFFNDTAPTEIYTLSLHDALPISADTTTAWSTAISPRPRRPRTSTTSISRRPEEHTSELQSLAYLVCRLLLEKKKKKQQCIDTRKTKKTNIQKNKK